MKALLEKLIAALKYPSTLQGLTTLLTLAGVVIAPDKLSAIIAAGVAVFGAIDLFLSDSDVKPKP